MCQQEEDDLKLFIVADGMGGYNGGRNSKQFSNKSSKKLYRNKFY